MSEYNPGDNLTSYPHLDFLSARSPEELRDMLITIRLPYKIINIYASGSYHYAWVSLTSPIIKKKTRTKRS